MFLGWNSLILIGSPLVALYFYLTRNFNYWKSRGIDGPKPRFLFGTVYQMFSRDVFENSRYNVSKHGKIHGLFLGPSPILVVAEPKTIKQITIKDFHLFVNRSELVTGDPLNDRSLFNLLGEDWKKMRSIISPTFSSGKMLKMHSIVVDCVKRLENELDRKLNENVEVEIKQLMSNFTIDVIATCAFGAKINTYDEKHNEFVVNAQKAFRGSWRLGLFLLFSSIFPGLLQWLEFRVIDPSVTNFFRAAIRRIISNRETEGGKHNDYIQLMINARNQVSDNEKQDTEYDNTDNLFRESDDQQIRNSKQFVNVSEDDVLATSFVFFIAGYETTAATLSHLLYSLALNENCQQRLFEELDNFGPDFKYEDIAKMSYLEACVAETLRLYNPIPSTTRVASEDYKIGDTDITIPKGMVVNFDFNSVHHNPEYYPDPDKWDPQRFLPENRDKLVPYTYMPFGMGPRNCVGMRFALMEVKTAAAYLVYKYRLFKSVNTQPKLIPKKFEIILTTGDIKIGLESRN